MSVEGNNESGWEVDEAEFAAIGRFVLDAMHLHPQTELSILMVDTDVMTDLHVQWMDEPGPTDVLSFPSGDYPLTEGETYLYVGDMALSLERARKQAEEYGHSYEREVAFLTAHSVLHCLGYDHVDGPEQEREMFSRQEAILSGMGLSR